MVLRRILAGWFVLVVFVLQLARSAHGAGTITNCTEATLRRALIGGGVVNCNCDGVITLTNTIIITNDVTIQAAGHSVQINGGSHVRLFVVNPGVSLSINHIGLFAGLANPTNSPAGTIPGSDGGAIYNNRGNLIILDSNLAGNVAVGQSGVAGDPSVMNGGNGQEGGAGRGGAIFNNGGVVVLSAATFLTNQATGGLGGNGANGSGTGNGPTGGNGGSGGNGMGGAIFNANDGTVMLRDSTLASNLVTGASGGLGGTGIVVGFNGRNGYSGDALGGALFSDGGQIMIVNSTFTINVGRGATATNELPALRREEGVTGRNGGNAFGGAIFNANGKLAVTNSTFFGNSLTGGVGGTGGRGGTNLLGSNGGAGGSGGMAQGGTLYAFGGQVFLVNCTISDSSVAGGPGGVGGLAGGTLGSNGQAGSHGSAVGGAIFSGLSGDVSLGNTILNHSTGAANVAGTASDMGANLSSDESFNIGSVFPMGVKPTTSQNSVAPLLGVLTNNGGPTQTMAISSNSPAVDAALDFLCLPFDQRGFTRFGHCDIGAFEYRGSILPSATGLAVARGANGGGVVVSWRSDALEYQLLSATNLNSTTRWSLVKTTATITNGVKAITIPTTNKSQFFELIRTNSGP